MAAGAVGWARGWGIVAAASGVVAAACAATLLEQGSGEDGLRSVIRLTARTSLVLFLGAFTASALARLRPGPVPRWLLAHRRYVGVSFAASHFMHLAAIVALAARLPGFWAERATTIVVGGIGYVAVLAMTATSFDRTAAWLGPRRWQRLHTVCAWYLWGVFLVTYLAMAAASLRVLPEILLLLAALGLRITARRR